MILPLMYNVANNYKLKTMADSIEQTSKESLDRYFERGIDPGHFLKAVLENDLREAVQCGDNVHINNLKGIIAYCYEKLPFYCWGSKQNVEDWVDSKAGF